MARDQLGEELQAPSINSSADDIGQTLSPCYSFLFKNLAVEQLHSVLVSIQRKLH